MNDTADYGGSSGVRRRTRRGWPAALAFVLVIAAGVGFGWSYVVEASNWWLGGFLALGLLALGAGLVYWALYLSPPTVERGAFPYPQTNEAEQAALAEEWDENQEVVTRRRFLGLLLGAGLGVLAIATLFPVQSLGPLPDNVLFRTAWRRGSRLVTIDGKPIGRDALSQGGFLVAFPEGATDSAASQIVLFHLSADKLKLPAGREGWAPDGFVAYSALCTHAGCPATQYEDESQVLLCPCHESIFDITRGAQAISGPAHRALPQLPLMIDNNGDLVAQGDFAQATGPGFWNLP